MLRNAQTLKGAEIRARDGKIGRVKDFYFDDQHWTVRYLVVDTDGWLSGRRVLISPVALGVADWREPVLRADLTCEQVRNSPGLDAEQPVSREEEAQLTHYYNWPAYWGMAGPADGGLGMTVPAPLLPPPEIEAAVQRRGAQSVVPPHHLRSVRNLTGHRVEAPDGSVGHVEDFVIDDLPWTIRYLVVDTRDWLPGKNVLVAPHWVHEVGWEDGKVYVALRRDIIKDSPAYDPQRPVTPDYSTNLQDYYDRPRVTGDR